MRTWREWVEITFSKSFAMKENRDERKFTLLCLYVHWNNAIGREILMVQERGKDHVKSKLLSKERKGDEISVQGRDLRQMRMALLFSWEKIWYMDSDAVSV